MIPSPQTILMGKSPSVLGFLGSPSRLMPKTRLAPLDFKWFPTLKHSDSCKSQNCRSTRCTSSSHSDWHVTGWLADWPRPLVRQSNVTPLRDFCNAINAIRREFCQISGISWATRCHHCHDMRLELKHENEAHAAERVLSYCCFVFPCSGRSRSPCVSKYLKYRNFMLDVSWEYHDTTQQ